MASDKGFPTKDRETGRDIPQDHVTAQPVREKQWAKDVLSHSFVQLIGTDDVEASSTTSIINATAHVAITGDTISFTSGNLNTKEYKVIRTTANTIEVGELMSEAPAAADTFEILRHKAPKVGADGNLQLSTSPAPIRFTLDGADQEVTEDTVTPSNNAPLPVKLTSTSGDINITAGDLNVQTSHSGASFDSMRIGDGTNLMAVNASLEATTRDADAITALGALLTELQAKADLAETQPVSAASLPLPTGAATEATLASLDGKDFATQTTLAALLTELEAKADLTETQPVSIASLPIATGASTEAKQDDTITALGNLLTELQLKADLTETQPVSLASSPLPTGAATETTLAALLTELQAKADLTETQPVSLASSPLPTGAATEATLATLLTEATFAAEDFATETTLGSLLTEATFAAEDFASETTLAAQSAKLPASLGAKTSAASLSVTLSSDEPAISVSQAATTVTEFVRNDYTSTSVTTGAYVELIASTSATVTKMRIFDSSGQTLKIATGAAASEVDLFLVFPGGNEEIEVNIPSGTRISIQAVSATADSGEISINLIG